MTPASRYRAARRGIAVATVLVVAGGGGFIATVSRAAAGGPDAAAAVAAAFPADLVALFRRPATVPTPPDNALTAAKVVLGEKLFHETALSGAGDRNCATCHDPARDFQDGLARGAGLDGRPLPRRTPFLWNVGWGERFFWDGRADSLETQALGPVQAPLEMNQTLDVMVDRLRARADYAPLFAAAFPDAPQITARQVARALASYERTLVSPDSAFDRWLAGDATAVSDAARRGFALFTGKGQCVSCHSGWQFTDQAFHDIGLPGDDRGRGAVLDLPALDHAFKTPSLRGVARRPPYMHDGSLPTLAAVVDHYSGDRVARDSGDRIARPTLSPDLPTVTLDAGEKADLVAFLTALDPLPATVAAVPQPAGAVADLPPAVATSHLFQKHKQFSVSHIQIRAGQSVQIDNEDVRDHNIRVHEPGFDYDSGVQSPGQSIAIPFEHDGRFTVFCGIHPKMKLVVDVH